MIRIGKALFVLCAFSLLWTATPAEAAVVHWRTSVVNYSADGKDIKDVLKDFAASQGIPADINSDVSGTFTGKFTLSPQRFLDTLASSFGFVWYYDGQVLEITAASDMKSTLLHLDTASLQALRDALNRLGIEDPRFPVAYDDAEGSAMVNGPPRYVQMVQQVADDLDANAARRGGSEVRVFPLYHAWAQDRSVDVDGNTISVRGVASVLNGLFHPGAKGAGAGTSGVAAGALGNITRNTPMQDLSGSSGGNGLSAMMSGSGGSSSSVPPLPPGGLFGGSGATPSPQLAALVRGANGTSGGANGSAAGAGSGTSAASNRDSDLPVIEADQRTNSVLIRDLPERMGQYQTLISRLDVKPQLIEIEAHIIEIDDGALQQLGVDWTAHNSRMDIQTGTGTAAQNTYNGTLSQSFGTTTLSDGSSVAATPVGLSMSAVLGDAGRYLMARITALQQDNKARIEANPKIVTLDNIEAVMNNKTQFFVPVSGYTSADLYSVSTGVSLRVLPMVVDERGQTQIKLDVAIQDGELSTSQTVSNLPVITSSDINTEAFVKQGQALLIAGYRTKNDSTGVTGIPYLSKIPLLGALFRTNNDQHSHMERLFLLLPRVIPL